MLLRHLRGGRSQISGIAAKSNQVQETLPTLELKGKWQRGDGFVKSIYSVNVYIFGIKKNILIIIMKNILIIIMARVLMR